MRNPRSNQLLPAPPIVNFWSGIKKIALGVMLLLVSEVLSMEAEWDESLTKHAIYTVGTAAIVGGLCSFLDNTLIWYSKKLATTRTSAMVLQSTSRKKRQKSRRLAVTAEHEQNKFVQHAAIYHRFQKYQNVLLNVFNCFSMAVMLNRYCDGWTALPDNVSVFDLSFPESLQENSAGPIFSFFHSPLIIPTIIVFSIIGSAYNVKEFFSNIASRYPRQNDPPFFGFLNAFSQISLTAVLARKLVPNNELSFTIKLGEDFEQQLALLQKAIESPMRTPKLAYFVSWLNSAAVYQSYQSIATFFTNIIFTFVSRPEIEVEESAKSTSKKPRKRRKRLDEQHYGSKLFQSYQHDAAEGPSTLTARADSSQAFVPTVRRQSPKTKIKTRGTAGKGYAEQPIVSRTIERLPNILYCVEAGERTVKLNLINQFRSYSQIKERLIDRELTQLTRFLPSGKIINITGSEHALAWEWQNKKYRLKFETPHGTNSQYKGRKLRKILNILETGYLWGCGRENIRAYLARNNNSSRYLGSLVNVLLRRPDFEEPYFRRPGPNIS